MCPFSSLPPSEGPNRFSPAPVEDSRTRRKSVSNACERCRRRKIKCDGVTPCSTCKRFSLQCIRAQKPREVLASEHQAALEGRIHQLESQLAAHINTPVHGMEYLEPSFVAGAPSMPNWSNLQAPYNLNTAIQASFTVDDLGLRNLATTCSVPSIAASESELNQRLTSPSSPVPSFWSGITRASSPEMCVTSAPSQLALTSQYSLSSMPFATRMEPHIAPSWEFMADASSSRLKSEIFSSREHSRNASMSSMSVNSDDRSMAPIPEVEDDLLPLDAAPCLPRQGLFAAQHTETATLGAPQSNFTDRSRALTSTPQPSLFEAKTLTANFVQYIDTLKFEAYSVSPQLFSHFCEMVYPYPQRVASVEMSASLPMARFHVFLSMAIAMKLRIRNSPEKTNALLETCYALAMQQSSASTFWQEQGGPEAAQLLSVFASISKTSENDPRSL